MKRWRTIATRHFVLVNERTGLPLAVATLSYDTDEALAHARLALGMRELAVGPWEPGNEGHDLPSDLVPQLLLVAEVLQ